MAFDFGSAMSGAMTGSQLGPWGAVGGGLLGGFMGGSDDFEPEYYTAENYARDMAPYQDMIDEQYKTGTSLMNRQSNINRLMNTQTMNNAMDQMGTANIVAQRNMAQQGGGIANSGLLQQMIRQNMGQYGASALAQSDQNYMNMFNQGLKQRSGAMQHLGDVSAGLAELNAGNIGTQNAYALHQQTQGQKQLGGLLGQGMGTLAGLEDSYMDVDDDGNPLEVTRKGLDVIAGWF